MSTHFSSYLYKNLFFLGYHSIILMYLLGLYFYTVVDFDIIFTFASIINPLYFKSVLYYLYGHYGYLAIMITHIICIFSFIVNIINNNSVSRKILIFHAVLPIYGSMYGFLFYHKLYCNFGFVGEVLGTLYTYYTLNIAYQLFYVISFLLFVFIIKLKTIHMICKKLYVLDLFKYCYSVILSWVFFIVPFLKRILPDSSHVSIELLIHQSIYSDFYNIMKDDKNYLLLEESLVFDENINNMLPYQIITHNDTIRLDYYIDVDVNDIQLLIDTLNYFEIKVIVVKSIEGPLVNTIIVTPDKEIKLSKINSLLNDIARICGKSDLRMIYPLGDYPHSIAFEYAHHKQKTIYFFDYAYEKNFIESGPLVLLLGVNTFGIPFYLDIAKAPHVLVAGTTGSGKSNMLNLIIIELIWKNNKNAISLILIDPKKSEFFNYSIFPHLLFPIANLMSDIEIVIKNTLDIMDERYDLFQKYQCKNINEYNQKHLPLNFIILIIDEYADIVIQSKQLESKIIRLLQMSRAAGIHVIIATQRPSADIISSIIKSNLPVRMACKVINSINSRVILDVDGAEKLLGNSDMIILINNLYSRVHGLYIDQESIEKIKTVFEHK